MSGELDEEYGKKKVKEIVDRWSKVYINSVYPKESEGNCLNYVVEFSKPGDKKPIPHGTVKINF